MSLGLGIIIFYDIQELAYASDEKLWDKGDW